MVSYVSIMNNLLKKKYFVILNINAFEIKSHVVKRNKSHDPEIIKCLKIYDYIGLLGKHANQSTDICLPEPILFEKTG